MIIVNAHMYVKGPEKRELLELAGDLANQAQRDKHCFSCNFYENAFGSGEFVFFGEWRSKEDLQNAMRKDAFKALTTRLPELLEDAPEIRVYEAGSVQSL